MPTLPNNPTDQERQAHNKYYRLYRLKHLKKLREYKRAYNAKWRKEHGYPSEKKYRKKWPKKVSARLKVRYALQTGKLKRQPCQFCGNPKTDAHHDNYDKPLQVRWLCRLHHTAWHRTRAVEKSS